MKKAPDDKLISLYKSGLSCSEIANKFSMSRQAVWERLTKLKVKMRKRKQLPKIKFNGIYFTKNKNGYYRATTNRDKQLTLHRYKYELLVKKLPPDHDVHHLDENKENNNINNLISLSKRDHTLLHNYLKGLKNV